MDTVSDGFRPRFPIAYLAAVLFHLSLVIGAFWLPIVVPAEMGAILLCSMLVFPVGVLVTGWGLDWLSRDGEVRYPALRWLVWVPGVFVGVLGFALG